MTCFEKRRTPRQGLGIIMLAGIAVASVGSPANARIDTTALPVQWAGSVPVCGEKVFKVRRGGSEIGEHKLRFEQDGDELRVDVDIDLEVKFAFLTLYEYRHDISEVWRDGKLVEIRSTTDNNGKEMALQATRDGDPLLSEGLLPTSYWNPATFEQDKFFNSQDGSAMDVTVEAMGAETIETASGPIEARRYAVRGDLNVDLWYDARNRWVKTQFDAKGETVDYELVSDERCEVATASNRYSLDD